MDLTAAVIDDAVHRYPELQPLAAVETEHLDMLPNAFASGDYGWRDAEWVVQWYGRRWLGAFPNAARRTVEDRYGENDFDLVRSAIGDAVATTDTAAKLDALTALEGVDVPVASAFLQFIDPEHYLVVGEREWTVLQEYGALKADYPDEPTASTYERHLATCRTVADRADRGLWDVYRTLWVLASNQGTDTT